MASRIKGITVQIGGDTTGLDKALKGVNKEIGSTKSELKDVERLLKLDPKNTELLRQKYNLLNKQVDQTEDKLKQLKEAEKQVQKQFKEGKISEDQYNALKREIIATERELDQMKDSAKQTERAISGVDEDPIEEVAKAADKAEESLKEAGKEADSFGDHLKAEVIVEGAKGIISALKDVAEESKEYMKIMGSLEVSSKAAGYTAEETSETFRHLYGVLADEQSAATTTANLQAIGLEQKKIKEITNACIGAWSKYGDSIPIDGLAEAINETIKAGQVTGGLADILNWGSREGETFGVKMKVATEANEEWNNSVKDAQTAEDYFNLALSQATTEAERANLILRMMASQGLTEAGEAWLANNEALVDSNNAQAEMQAQLAELGETVLPLFTKITEAIAGVLGWFNSLSEGQQNVILIIVGLVAALGTLIPVLSAVGSVLTFIAANPIVLIIAAIAAFLVAIIGFGDEIQAILSEVDDFMQNIFAKDFTEIFGPVLGDCLNGFMHNIKGIWDAIMLTFSGTIDFIKGVFTGDWDRAWNGVKKILEGYFKAFVTVAKAPLNGLIGLINGAISGINLLIEGINSIKFKIPDWVPELGGAEFGLNLKTIDKIEFLAKGGVLTSGTAVVGEAGPEILTVNSGKAVVQPLTGSATAGKGLGELMGLLNTYLPHLADGRMVVLDTGAMVGEMAPAMNHELGRIAELERYR